MIELPENAELIRQGDGRVDVRLLVGDVVAFGDREITGALVFRAVSGKHWVVASVGSGGTWEIERIGDDEVPEAVRDMV